MTETGKTYCSVCAWRKNCQKRFTMKDGICPDYTRDLSLPKEEEEKERGEDERADSQGH